AGPAAERLVAMARHLDEARPRGAQHLARRLDDSISAAQITGVVERRRRALGCRHPQATLPDQLRQKLRVVHDVKSRRGRTSASGLQTGVLVLERVEAVRTVGQDALDLVAIDEIEIVTGEFLEQAFLAEAARRVAAAALAIAENAIRDS